ncbi:hypothetical protein N8306_02100 [Yoonia sp.]|nr:hypothetical protein [Yoonia sp.]
MIGRVLNCIIFVCLGLWLAACGGGGGSGATGGGNVPAPDPRLARLDTYQAQLLRVLGDPSAGVSAMPLAADHAIPIEGTVSFVGAATIRVELQAAPLVLYGDATLDLDFATGIVNGSLMNFFGAAPQGRVENYQGEITVAGDRSAQNTTLDYTGTLQTSGQILGFDGTLDALFLGTSVTAIAASDLEAAVDHNGTWQSATVIVIGEGAVIPPPDPPPVSP